MRTSWKSWLKSRPKNNGSSGIEVGRSALATQANLPVLHRKTLFAPGAAKSKAATALQARPDGGEVLTFYDDQGVGRTSAGISPDGFPFVGISDMTGMVRGALRLHDDAVRMALVDKNGKVAWSAP